VERFGNRSFVAIKLPFFGTWSVSQGHNGEYTHKGEWGNAWDFVILNNKGLQYKNDGYVHEDYYCFGKSVVAPADGVIVQVVNNIPDNPIGDVNTIENWGNTVVIKHNDYLYSKLCHLKKGSVEVKEGEKIKFGKVIGKCGNSGRSPYPHLHFQMQATPFVGSETLDYPLSHFILKTGSGFKLKSFDKPKEGDIVSNIHVNELLKKALHFIPGQTLKFTCVNNEEETDVSWEVRTDVYNNSYIHCEETNSFAYFYNDGTIHYFKNFVGNRNSNLFRFYLAFYKVQTGYYQGLEMPDKLPVNQSFRGGLLFLQDFIAPFHFFLRSKYRVKYEYLDNELSPSRAKLKSVVENYVFSKKVRSVEFEILIDRKGIKSIVFSNGNKEEGRCERKN
jgi:hypothetical protein